MGVDSGKNGRPTAGDGGAGPELTRQPPLIVGTVASGRQFNDIRLRMALGGGMERPVKVSGRRIPPIGSESLLVLLSFEEDAGADRAS